MRASAVRLFVFLASLAVAMAACKDVQKTRRIVESFVVVPGTPSVDEKAPSVDTDPTRATDTF